MNQDAAHTEESVRLGASTIMKIKTRSKKRESIDSVGEVVAVYLERPLVKIDAGHEASDARAVCLNGRWFIEAPDPVPERLEEEWVAAG